MGIPTCHHLSIVVRGTRSVTTFCLCTEQGRHLDLYCSGESEAPGLTEFLEKTLQSHAPAKLRLQERGVRQYMGDHRGIYFPSDISGTLTSDFTGKPNSPS